MRKLNQEKLEMTLRQRLAWDIEQYRVSAAHLLVLQDGKEVVSLCEGYQNWDTREPLRRDAMYRLCSMTKPVTGVAALIAEDKGYFKITDKLEDYLPEFGDMYIAKLADGKVVAGEKNKTPLRIYQCLSHCNGIMAQTPVGEKMVDETPRAAYQSLQTIVEYVSKQPLVFEPETFSAYTATESFDAVARIIEMKSGMPYARFVQKNIFDPLGLKDITYTPTEEQWERMLMVTDRGFGKGFITQNLGKHTAEHFPLSYTSGGGGLTASMADFAVFAEMLQNGGTYKGVQIFSPERLKELTTPYVPPERPGRDPVSSWGLGVRVVDKEDVLPIGSFGWSGAYGTHFWVDPVNKITALYMRGSLWYERHGCGTIGQQYEKDIMACLEL